MAKMLEQLNKTQDVHIFNRLFDKYGTNKKCFRCGTNLLKSDLKGYKYLCIECDENFYEFETLEK